MAKYRLDVAEFRLRMSDLEPLEPVAHGGARGKAASRMDLLRHLDFLRCTYVTVGVPDSVDRPIDLILGDGDRDRYVVIAESPLHSLLMTPGEQR